MLQFEKNPFPGMNPWMESHWGDVHTRLTMYSCDAIQRQLPADLHARVEEYLSTIRCRPKSHLRRKIKFGFKIG